MARSKNTGSITRIDNVPKARCRHWRLRVVYRGKERTRRFKGTYAQAEQALVRFVAELNVPLCEYTFGEYAVQWLYRRERAGELSEQTLRRDAENIKSLNREFEYMRLDELTRINIADGLLNIKHGNSASGKELSGTTMNRLYTTMKQILKNAMFDELISKNPMDTLQAPRKDTKERSAASPDEVRRLLELLALRPLDGHTIAIRLAVLAGPRRSEAVGLEWRDYQQGTLRIRRSISECSGNVKPTKSAAGMRTIPVIEPLAQALDAWRLVQAEQLMILDLEQSPTTPILTSTTGTRLCASNLARWWEHTRPEFGVTLTLHELRHTFLTMLANSGAPAQVLKSVAGWASIDMANTYVHTDDAANKAAIERLGQVI